MWKGRARYGVAPSIPVTVIKRFETLGEIHKGQVHFYLSIPKNITIVVFRFVDVTLLSRE
jgi:hypothetical protein